MVNYWDVPNWPKCTRAFLPLSTCEIVQCPRVLTMIQQTGGCWFNIQEGYCIMYDAGMHCCCSFLYRCCQQTGALLALEALEAFSISIAP